MMYHQSSRIKRRAREIHVRCSLFIAGEKLLAGEANKPVVIPDSRGRDLSLK